MARLSESKIVAGAADDRTRDFRELMRVQDAWLTEREAEASGLGPGEYVGRVVRFPAGDGYAVYLVTGYDPSLHPTEQLELAWVEYGDNWGVHPATIRGLVPGDLD